MHQKCRIRNFEDISKCLLRNSKLSSPYIYPQLLDQIDEDNPNENTSKAGTIIFLVKTDDTLSFSLAALKSNLKEPKLKKETSDIISLISKSSRLYPFYLKKLVWWFYLPLFRPTRELILFKYCKIIIWATVKTPAILNMYSTDIGLWKLMEIVKNTR